MYGTFSRNTLTAVLLGLLAQGAQAARSITYYGITWSFAQDHQVGSFANGEPWVVGPVTITNITPNTSQSTYNQQHGSMINPMPMQSHGFDSNASISSAPYEAAKNVARSFPFTLNAGQVLVSAKSQAYYPTWIKTYAALTALSAPAPVGSFRPSVFGSDRSIRFNVSQINWNALKNLAAPASTPSKASIAAQMSALPWFEMSAVWNGNALQADDNTMDGPMVDGTHYRVYGRETADKFGEIGMWLNTNQPLADKQAIAIQMIQNGLDIFAYVKNGGGYYHDGGHKAGRKLPLVMAAMMLNDSELRAMAANKDVFQEDQQVWFVTQADVNRAVWTPTCPGDSWCGREFLRYTQADVGKAEWGIRHRFEPIQDNASWSATYRSTVYAGMMGPWLAAYLMDAQSTWNHPAAFAYMERVRTLTGTSGGVTAARNAFYNDMWKHKDGGIIVPPPEVLATPTMSPAGGSFQGPVSVTLSGPAGATLRYTLNGSVPTSSSAAYSAPFTVSTGSVVKVVAMKSGFADSAVASGTFVFANEFRSVAGGFRSKSIETQTAGFTLRFDMIPSAANIDAVSGLSNGEASAFSSLATIVRFNSSGKIDARNGGAYQADLDLPYSGNRRYTVEMDVDVASRTYDVRVSVDGGSPALLARDYAFRSEQASVALLDKVSIGAVVGSHLVENISIDRNEQEIANQPLLAPTGGTYSGSVQVSLSSSTIGAQIRYTTDGSEPRATSTLYTGPLTLSRTLVLKAIAFKDGMTPSPIGSGSFTVNPIIVTPQPLTTPTNLRLIRNQ